MAETAAEQAAREMMNAALLDRIPALLTTAYSRTARRDWAGLLTTLEELSGVVAECRVHAAAARIGKEAGDGWAD